MEYEILHDCFNGHTHTQAEICYVSLIFSLMKH